MNQFTTDTFFKGQICVKQSRGGYRFSIDAVVLAYHTVPHPGEKVLDLGTGCGIIPLILAYRQPQIAIYGVEVQTELSELAVSNVRENQLEDRITVLSTDMKLIDPSMTAGSVDWWFAIHPSASKDPAESIRTRNVQLPAMKLKQI